MGVILSHPHTSMRHTPLCATHLHAPHTSMHHTPLCTTHLYAPHTSMHHTPPCTTHLSMRHTPLCATHLCAPHTSMHHTQQADEAAAPPARSARRRCRFALDFRLTVRLRTPRIAKKSGALRAPAVQKSTKNGAHHACAIPKVYTMSTFFFIFLFIFEPFQWAQCSCFWCVGTLLS